MVNASMSIRENKQEKINMTESKDFAALPVKDWQVARSLVEPLYDGQFLNSGESRLAHSDGMASILKGLNEDDNLLTAAYLFSVHMYVDNADEWIEKKFGPSVLRLVQDMHRLVVTSERARSEDKNAKAIYQPEALRKMLLAMCRDLRVVVLRLASRVQTLRFFSKEKAPSSAAVGYAEETLAIYAPLANRLGLWQLKWELEDLSFRYTHPKEYAEIAEHLAQTHEQRLKWIDEAIALFKKFLDKQGIKADVSGRPKHIYSIYRKMQRKHLKFEQLFDIDAIRIIVDTVEQCYEVLSLVQENCRTLSKEYDDYIAHPKPNGYQSLHTVVVRQDGRPLEVQIRTHKMHEFAEMGVAAHWRYKENGNSEKTKGGQAEEQRVAWLRQLIAWHSDVEESPETVGAADDNIYVLTPQGRVLELQKGSTPIDFAYHVHTQLGHHCRGARVDGVMVPLNTKLKTGQTVEIIAVKEGGPSRDWANPDSGFVATPRARTKVRQWFNAQQQAEQIALGRDRLDKELARLGKTATKLEILADRLGFENPDALYIAIAKDELSMRAVEQILAPEQESAEPEFVPRSATKGKSKSNVLVVGMDSMMTQLARCCHPAPPDEIVGFVTRGKGVTVHRIDCPNVRNLENVARSRMIDVSWGTSEDAVYPVDIYIVARDRIGLIKDISEVLVKENLRQLGLMLLTLGIGSVLGLMLAPVIMRRTRPGFFLLTVLSLQLIGLTVLSMCQELLAVFAVMFSVGLCIGLTDVAMNAQGIAIERLFYRPVMGALHAGYGIGGALGSAVGAVFASLGIGVTVTFLIPSIVMVFPVLWAVRHALPDVATKGTDRTAASPRIPVALIVCGLLVFLAFASEGACGEWGGLLLAEEKGAGQGVAAAVYGVFTVCALASRLVSDLLRRSFAVSRIVFSGAVIGLMGMALVIAAPGVLLPLIGFAVAGLGIGPICPLLYGVAGQVSSLSAARAASVVSVIGYTGLLFCPPLFGFLAHLTTYSTVYEVVSGLLLVLMLGNWVLFRLSHRALKK